MNHRACRIFAWSLGVAATVGSQWGCANTALTESTPPHIAAAPAAAVATATAGATVMPVVVMSVRPQVLTQVPGVVQDSLAVSKDGLLAVDGGWANPDSDQYGVRAIQLWDLKTRKMVRQLTSLSGTISEFVFSPDGRLLAHNNVDAGVTLWDVRTGRRRELLQYQLHDLSSGRIVFSPDGKMLAVGAAERIQIWRIGSGRFQGNIPFPYYNGEFTWTLDSKSLLVSQNTPFAETKGKWSREFGM